MFIRNLIIFVSCFYLVPLLAMEVDIKEDQIKHVEKESLLGGESGECYSTKLSNGELIRVTQKQEIECFIYKPVYSPGTAVQYKQKIDKKYFWILQKKFKKQQKK